MMNNYKQILDELKVILIYEIDQYNNYDSEKAFIVKHTLERILEEIKLLEDNYIEKDI